MINNRIKHKNGVGYTRVERICNKNLDINHYKLIYSVISLDLWSIISPLFHSCSQNLFIIMIRTTFISVTLPTGTIISSIKCLQK